MKFWMVRGFDRWARKQGLAHAELAQAALEISLGQHDGDLGGLIVKKRIARTNAGKSGGFRTIVAFRKGASGLVFFLHGYAKNEKADITSKERAALHIAAETLLRVSEAQLNLLAREGAILPIERTT